LVHYIHAFLYTFVYTGYTVAAYTRTWLRLRIWDIFVPVTRSLYLLRLVLYTHLGSFTTFNVHVIYGCLLPPVAIALRLVCCVPRLVGSRLYATFTLLHARLVVIYTFPQLLHLRIPSFATHFGWILFCSALPVVTLHILRPFTLLRHNVPLRLPVWLPLRFSAYHGWLPGSGSSRTHLPHTGYHFPGLRCLTRFTFTDSSITIDRFRCSTFVPRRWLWLRATAFTHTVTTAPRTHTRLHATHGLTYFGLPLPRTRCRSTTFLSPAFGAALRFTLPLALLRSDAFIRYHLPVVYVPVTHRFGHAVVYRTYTYRVYRFTGVLTYPLHATRTTGTRGLVHSAHAFGYSYITCTFWTVLQRRVPIHPARFALTHAYTLYRTRILGYALGCVFVLPPARFVAYIWTHALPVTRAGLQPVCTAHTPFPRI